MGVPVWPNPDPPLNPDPEPPLNPDLASLHPGPSIDYGFEVWDPGILEGKWNAGLEVRGKPGLGLGLEVRGKAG